MKLIILLAAVAWSNGAKLDRTYLPPNHAQSSGGSGNFLQTPVSGSSDYQNNGFNQANAGNGFADTVFGQNRNTFAQNDDYSQNGNGFAQNDAGFSQNVGFDNVEARPERAQAAFERNAAILRQDNTNDGETYAYAYETENGIVAEENGVATNGVEAQGGYSYTGDDGQVYSVRYTADQNGFVPQGDHLPTPPPIPEEILKALEQNARDEANGIYDDGSYNEGKYGNDNGNGQFNDQSGYNYNNNGNSFNAGGANNDAFNVGSDDDSIVTNNALLRSGNANNGAFGNAGNNGGFGNAGNQNGVEKAYLPPFEQNGQRYQATNGFGNQAGNGFNNQPQSNGFRNQGSNGVSKTYGAPEQFGQSQNGPSGRNGGSRNGGFRNQGSNGVEKAYLPPFAQNSATSGPAYDQTQAFRSQGPRNNGFGSRNGANREYLPPSANQRSNGRRPSFSARNGYQY